MGLQQISRTIQDNTFVKSSPQALEWNGSTLQKTNQPNLLVPGQQVMEPQTLLGRLAAGQRSLQINDGTGNFVSVVVNDEGYLINHMPIMGASPFGMVGPGKAVKFFGAAKTGTSVLGHYPQYVKVAETIGARTFQIPTKIWNKMTPAQ